MRVMIVDDSKVMRTIVRRMLRHVIADADVLEASDGQLALAELGTQQVDLILSDWNMPTMTGIELLEQLRAQGTRTRFGFVTSEGTPDMRARAQAAGASFFVSKPFTEEHLDEAIRGVVRQ